MNPDDDILNVPMGSIIAMDDGYKIMTSNGLSTLATAASNTVYVGNNSATATIGKMFDLEDFLEQHIMNRITIDHKVQEQELMKLKEVAPDYANEIKENIAKNFARDVSKKITYTKKHDKDADVHHFIGRAWVFTEEELKTIIEEARNA